MSNEASPFDDFRALLARMPGPDAGAIRARHVRMHAAPAEATAGLGRLGDLAGWVAAWQGRPAAVRRPLLAVFAGTHGAADAQAQAQTAARVEAIASGAAALSGICASVDLGLKVFDLALDVPTGSIAREAALDARGCAATMAFGMEALIGEPDLLCLGALGVGGEASAAAIAAALFGRPLRDWVGDAAVAGIVEAALACHAGALADPFELLSRLGGRETAAIAGAILAARAARVPVIIDGMAATAAAAILQAADPAALDHCLFAHVSAEPGHRRLLEAMNKVPLLALGLGSGEGEGAALAAGVVKSAIAAEDAATAALA